MYLLICGRKFNINLNWAFEIYSPANKFTITTSWTMSSEQGLSGEYLVRVNGSGDWPTAVPCLLYGNKDHKRRAEECEGQKSATVEEVEEGKSRQHQWEDFPSLIYCARRNCSVSRNPKKKKVKALFSLCQLWEWLCEFCSRWWSTSGLQTGV